MGGHRVPIARSNADREAASPMRVAAKRLNPRPLWGHSAWFWVFRTFEQAGRMPVFADLSPYTHALRLRTSNERSSPERTPATPRTPRFNFPHNPTIPHPRRAPPRSARPLFRIVDRHRNAPPPCQGFRWRRAPVTRPVPPLLRFLIFSCFLLFFQEQGVATYLSDNHKLFSRKHRANPAQKFYVE